MKLLGKLFAKLLYFSVETFIKQLKNAFVFVAIARQGSFPPSVVRMRSIILTTVRYGMVYGRILGEDTVRYGGNLKLAKNEDTVDP